MTSILDQFESNDLQTIPEETVLLEAPDTVKKKTRVSKKLVDESSAETEEKREQLSILSVLGSIDTYTGVKMSLGDVKRLSTKDVEKYYNRYQVTMGQQVTCGLIETGLEAGIELVSYILPIDDKKELISDLNKNELVKKELSNWAGLLVLKGGRFVALASAVFQVAKHIEFKTIKKEPEDEINSLVQEMVDDVLK